MTRFLGLSWQDDASFELHWVRKPTECLRRRGGRVSPLHPIDDAGKSFTLPDAGCLLVLFPESPRQTLAHLTRVAADVAQRSFMTHGLASTVCVCVDEAEARAMATELSDRLIAYELWPFNNSTIHLTDVVVWRRDHEDDAVDATFIDPDGFPQEILVELRQFNSNLALFRGSIASLYPEFDSLVAWLLSTVRKRAESIHENLHDLAEGSTEARGRLNQDVSILVDINSCLTMLISQSGSILPPVLSGSFPVGEFSLFGIGTVSRAAWRLYDHIERVFFLANHVSRVQSAQHSIGFDPGINSVDVDWATWRTAAAGGAIDARQPSETPVGLGRKHIVYFSSRWGFHETLTSMTLSWQSISSGSSREWNLLTLSHEFLHSYFREVIGSTVMESMIAEVPQLVNEYNRRIESRDNTPCTTYWKSVKLFLLNEVAKQRDLDQSTNGDSSGVVNLSRRRLVESQVREVMRHYLPDVVEEFVVHMLDYWYFYRTDDRSYVTSLWHSWALVPYVYARINHYALRTMLALASTNDTLDSNEAFEDALVRLQSQFDHILRHGDSSLVTLAMKLLDDEAARRDLWGRFTMSWNLVQFTKHFLIDREMYQNLTQDSQVQLDPDEPLYPMDPLFFPDEPVESPTAFIFDRFSPVRELPLPEDVEAASLWQMIVIL